jgi:hypothetical protein
MGDFRSFEVSDFAARQARSLGMSGDVAARVARMARRSAVCTSEFGNRRFGEFFLTVQGNVVTEITRVAE